MLTSDKNGKLITIRKDSIVDATTDSNHLLSEFPVIHVIIGEQKI
jgi:hypothetical protein